MLVVKIQGARIGFLRPLRHLAFYKSAVGLPVELQGLAGGHYLHFP